MSFINDFLDELSSHELKYKLFENKGYVTITMSKAVGKILLLKQ